MRIIKTIGVFMATVIFLLLAFSLIAAGVNWITDPSHNPFGARMALVFLSWPPAALYWLCSKDKAAL